MKLVLHSIEDNNLFKMIEQFTQYSTLKIHK